MAYNYKLRVRNLAAKAGTPYPVAIATMLNIIIKEVVLPPRINGFWKRILRRKVIFVNANLEEWQKQTVISHELGHILLHPHYHHFCVEKRSYYCSARHENEADQFAVEMMSQNDVDQAFSSLFLRDGWK